MVKRMMIEHSYHLDVSPVSLPSCTPDEIVAHYQLDGWAKTTNSFAIRFYTSGHGGLLRIQNLRHDIEAGTVWTPPAEPKLQDIVPEYYDISPQAYERWKAGAPTEKLTKEKIERALQTLSMNSVYLPYDTKTVAELHKEIDDYSGINSVVRGEPKPPSTEASGAAMELKGYFKEAIERAFGTSAAAAQSPYQNALNKVAAQQQVITSHDWHHDGNNWACLVCGSKFDPMTPTCSGINAADWAVPVWETEPVAVWKHGLCLGCQCELSPAMDGEGAVECNRCSR